MIVELEKGKNENIKINSKPEELAYVFCKNIIFPIIIIFNKLNIKISKKYSKY